MKTCMAASNDDGENSKVSPLFGRAPYFAFMDTDEKGEISNLEIEPNPYVNAGGGAGIQTSQMVVNSGAEALVAGSFGPNAHNVLSTGGIKMYSAAGMTLADAAKKLAAGELQEAGMGASHKGLGGGMGGGRGGGMGGGRGGGMGGGMGGENERMWGGESGNKGGR